MSLLRAVFLAALVVLPLGCISVGALPLGEDRKACKFKDGAVRVFRGKPDGRSYAELAIVNAQAAWWARTSWEDLLRALCREAARTPVSFRSEIVTAATGERGADGRGGNAPIGRRDFLSAVP